MGKPMGQHPIPDYIIPQNPKRDPKKGSRSRSLLRLALLLRQPVEVPKMVNHDQVSIKLGQGPTGPQHSPVTRPESLWSD
jgi:hypothetical protein